MSDHDDFPAAPDDDLADWVSDEVDAAWDDDDTSSDPSVADDPGDQVDWIDDDDVSDDAHDGDSDDLDVGSSGFDDGSPSIDLPLGDDVDDAASIDVPAMLPGFFGSDSVADVASWLAPDVDADALRDAFVGLAGDDPGVDARTTVQLLDGAGIDAHVTHGTLDDLADALDAGGRVVIAGEDGERYDVVDVDFRSDVLVVESDAGPRSIPLEAFEDAWSGGAFEMVVATGEDAAALTLVPLSLDPPELGR